jgi:hypothetical protein
MKPTKAPYIRDVYLAYLIQGARRTQKEGYPIIEPWMVTKEPPRDIIQWDKRSSVKDKVNYAISFYCRDQYFSSLQCNPKKYIEEVKKYQCVVGLDASPFDNMPQVVQKSQIYDNLAITYYYGRQGIPVIPNVRVGSECTFDSLEAYPINTLIAIGSNGFTHELFNRSIFTEQVSIIIELLRPIGIVVYGPVSVSVFEAAKEKEIPIYQYDSFMAKRNKKKMEAEGEK